MSSLPPCLHSCSAQLCMAPFLLQRMGCMPHEMSPRAMLALSVHVMGAPCVLAIAHSNCRPVVPCCTYLKPLNDRVAVCRLSPSEVWVGEMVIRLHEPASGSLATDDDDEEA